MESCSSKAPNAQINAIFFFAFVQINTFRFSQAVDLVASASGFTCVPECGPGFECKLGICKRKQCTQDCSGVAKQQLCGSNGITYNNMCELEKAKCELAREINKVYDGICKLMEYIRMHVQTE